MLHSQPQCLTLYRVLICLPVFSYDVDAAQEGLSAGRWVILDLQVILSYMGSLLHGVRKLVEAGKEGRLISILFPWEDNRLEHLKER